MRIIILCLLSIVAANAQTITRSIDVTFNTPEVPALKAFIAANFMEQADANGDEVLSNAETLAWFEGRAQNVVNVLQDRAREWAEANQPTVLPQEYQDALAAKIAADAALRALRERR